MGNEIKDIMSAIDLDWSSYNVIYENSIINNNNGISIYDYPSRPPSNNNVIYHNNFINNQNDARDDSSNNWDDGYPSGGNYWSNYVGSDNFHGRKQKKPGPDGIDDTPHPIPGEGEVRDRFPFMNPYGWLNKPPEKPAKPSGPLIGIPGEPYRYLTNTTDPDGDQLYYQWNWGDGNKSDWLGPYESGKTVNTSYVWSTQGTYKVRVRAKDENGGESKWSKPLRVKITGYNMKDPVGSGPVSPDDNHPLPRPETQPSQPADVEQERDQYNKRSVPPP